MTKINDELLRLFEAGELVPLCTVGVLKGFSPATVCRWALSGRIPAIRIGRRILTHDTLVREALAAAIIPQRIDPATTKPVGPPAQKTLGHEAAKNSLKKRGLKI